ncbi:unnamed protein product [Rotaria socialis]|uniref:Uncharacterized protein n=2 Tax=Rotaria socialis TaxID=392032 RepID=A0A820XZM2_9BILA|nr:unnamed protein product [Rotaria socialis]
MDVLYSLLDIKNQQLHIIAQDKIFTNILNFVPILSTNDNSSISNRKLDRFCFEILPQIHHNHLAIAPLSINNHLPLPLKDLSSSTFSSSTLTKLCINVLHFGDCQALLDGRLTQLIIFIVQIDFYLRYAIDILQYVVPLLRRMSHLEERTLHVYILNRPTFVNGIHLHKEILIYMPRLDKLTFYIKTTNEINGSIHRLCNDDIQRTFSYTNHRPVISIVDYFGTYKAACHVFSLPFPFHRLQWITNNFPPIIFSSVTDLKLSDTVRIKPEFFIRIA